jgi:membrane protein DedA with SNARE-associated domain
MAYEDREDSEDRDDSAEGEGSLGRAGAADRAGPVKGDESTAADRRDDPEDGEDGEVGDDPESGDAHGEFRGPARRRPSRRAVALVGLPLAVLVVISNVGDALAAGLVDTRPALLIALNARNRNLILVSNYVDAWTFYSIGFVRLVISDPLFFLLGYWYGDGAVRWMERRTKTWGQILRQFERWFSKAAYPIVFIAPNNIFCLFAGASGMPVAAFLVLNITGTIFRLWLVRKFGEALESPIDALVGWIGDNRVILLAISISLVLLSIALEAKRGETEVTALTHLDEELERELADDDSDAE